jgi:hypothetical protein
VYSNCIVRSSAYADKIVDLNELQTVELWIVISLPGHKGCSVSNFEARDSTMFPGPAHHVAMLQFNVK